MADDTKKVPDTGTPKKHQATEDKKDTKKPVRVRVVSSPMKDAAAAAAAATSSPVKSASSSSSRKAKKADQPTSSLAKPLPAIPVGPPAAIPSTPLFDDDKKWAAHVLATATTMASQQSISVDGISFPVRILTWGVNKTPQSGGAAANSSNAPVGANRGAIAMPGTNASSSTIKDPKKKGRFESYNIYMECGSFKGVPGAKNDQFFFIPIDVNKTAAAQFIKPPVSRITGENITDRVLNVGQRVRIFTNNSSIKNFTSMDPAFCIKARGSLSVVPSADSDLWDKIEAANKAGAPMKRATAGEKTAKDTYKPTRFCKLAQLPKEVLEAYLDRTSAKMTDEERINLEYEFPEIAYQDEPLVQIISPNMPPKPVRICSNLNCSMFMPVVKTDYIGQSVGDFLAGLKDPATANNIENAYQWTQNPYESNVYMVFRPTKEQDQIAGHRARKKEDLTPQELAAPNPEVTSRWAMRVFEGSGYKCYSSIEQRDVVCLRFFAAGEIWQPGVYYKEPQCIATRVLVSANTAAWSKQIVRAYGVSNTDMWLILAPLFLEYTTNVFSCRVNVNQTNRIPAVAGNGGNIRNGDTLTCALDVEEIFADIPGALARIGIPISKNKVLELVGCIMPTEAEIASADTSALGAATCLSEMPNKMAAAIAAKCTFRVLCNTPIEDLIPSIDTEIGDAIFTPSWCSREDITLPSGKVLKASDDLRKATIYTRMNDSPVRYVWAVRPDIKTSFDRISVALNILHNGTKYDDNGMPCVSDPAAVSKRALPIDMMPLEDDFADEQDQ